MPRRAKIEEYVKRKAVIKCAAGQLPSNKKTAKGCFSFSRKNFFHCPLDGVQFTFSIEIKKGRTKTQQPLLLFRAPFFSDMIHRKQTSPGTVKLYL